MKDKTLAKTGGGTTRNSSFELMRIFCMLFIIAHHFAVHANWNAESAGLIRSISDLSPNTFFLQCLSSGGKWPCNAFALLTGYFTVTVRVHYKRIANIIMQLCFYSWLIVALAGAFRLQELSFFTVFKNLFPFLYGNWFCVWYVLFSLFVPFVNRLLHDLSKREHEKFIYILFVVWSAVPCLTKGWSDQGYLMMFLTMYVIGAYIRLYAQGSAFECLPWKRIALLSFVFLYGSVFALDACSAILEVDFFATHAMHFSALNSIASVACAVSFFMLFRQKEFHSQWINRVSGATLGIYLVHDNSILSPQLWNEWVPNAQYLYSPWLPAFAVVKVIAVFVVCMLIDKGREWIFRHSVDKWLNALWAKHTVQESY